MAKVVAAGIPKTQQVEPVWRPRQAQRRLSPNVMDQAIADYQSGLSAKAVGHKYGIDTQTVLNNLNARGITARPKPTKILSGDNLQRAFDLRAVGWSYAAIGREFGVSHTTVATALKTAS